MAHRCTSVIKNDPSMYLNDKKWPINVPIKTGTPIHVPHFRKKKGPIDVPGSLILRPMFAAHPYNHFCTEYPPGSTVRQARVYRPNFKSRGLIRWVRGVARLFKMRGRQGGLRGEQGADRDSKWRLSIDLCTKCNFIWGGKRGAEFLPEGAVAPPCPPSGYATAMSQKFKKK